MYRMLELRKYNVDIACFSEVRIPDSGHSVIKVPGEEACYHLYNSGVVDNSERHGVAIALIIKVNVEVKGYLPKMPINYGPSPHLPFCSFQQEEIL